MSATATRAATRAAAARRRRRTTIAGIGISIAALATAVVLVFYVSDRPAPLTRTDLPNLTEALSTVPAEDVSGEELGAPRPAGSTRSFFRRTGRVTTAIYTQRHDFAGVISHLQSLLASAGWSRPEGSEAGRIPTRGQTWTSIYSRGAAVLQVSIVSENGVTATTYIYEEGA